MMYSCFIRIKSGGQEMIDEATATYQERRHPNKRLTHKPHLPVFHEGGINAL